MPSLFSTVEGIFIGNFDDERNQIALSLKPSVVANAKKVQERYNQTKPSSTTEISARRVRSCRGQS
jgi:hypothetical protein